MYSYLISPCPGVWANAAACDTGLGHSFLI
jgi:hypothetical protein